MPGKSSGRVQGGNDVNQQEQNKSVKQEWVRPELKQLVAGAAESQRGARPDGGGGAQGS